MDYYLISKNKYKIGYKMKIDNSIKVLMIEDNPGDIVLIREMLDDSQ